MPVANAALTQTRRIAFPKEPLSRRLNLRAPFHRTQALPPSLDSISGPSQDAFRLLRDAVEHLSSPPVPNFTSVMQGDVTAASEQIVEKVVSLLEPTPGAAEALGPGFGTKLIQQLVDAVVYPFQDGHLSAAKLINALSAVQETLEVIFPDTFGAEMRASFSELWTAVNAFAIAVNGSLPSEEQGTLMSVVFAVVGFLSAAFLLAAIFKKDAPTFDLDSEYEVPKKYSPEAVERYFQKRQFVVWSRCASVLASLGSFYIGIQSDRSQGKLKENEAMRAVQLRNIIEKLGPTYVKVAQSISTRVDILSEKYFTEIERLQDRVPPFSSEEAYTLIELELGKKVQDVFAQLTETTVASASLGQVYRGVLRREYGGGEVAVKVQRPNVLRQVALDLYVARLLAIHVMPKIQKTKTDYLGLVDEYAVRFFQEMDYEQEAQNGILFREQMASIEGVVVPQFYPSLTTRKILVSEWIQGEKLSESSAPDVRELCNTLLNVYLVQLLDTGFLHADPHPGNLIRTPEGKICIIDFGLMTTITKLQRDNLVEYIANLTTMNWTGVAYSLKALGFIDANSPDPVELGLVEPLELIFSQIVRGGGAQTLRKRIEGMPRLDQVRQQLEELSNDFPFAVPTFFTLILRSFSVIEGIALGVDPDYSITMECFPYISRRLLTDNDPRMNKILKGVLYGDKSHLDVERIERVTKALREFTVSGLPSGGVVLPSQPMMNATIREALEVLFSPNGSYIQDLLVEEMVAATDALSREALSSLAGAYVGSVPAMISLRTLEMLGPLRSFLFPFLTPAEILERLQPALLVTPEDKEALSTVRGIMQLVMQLDVLSQLVDRGERGRSMNDALNKAASELVPMIPDLLPGVARITELFVRRLASRVMTRMAEALESDASSEYSRSMEALE